MQITKIILTAIFTGVGAFTTIAQSPEQVYSSASKAVQIKMDANQRNGENLLSGITAQHVFKVKGPFEYSIADLDVHLIEAPGMINYSMNLSRNWNRIKSIEFQCNSSFSLDEIKTYLDQVKVTIVKDKVTYVVQ